MNKKLNLFKSFTLKELLNTISGKFLVQASQYQHPEFLVEIYHEDPKKSEKNIVFCSVQIDERVQNEVGFFDGPNCIASLSLSDTLKLIDHDTVKVIKSMYDYNIGFTLKFSKIKPYNFL